VRKTENQKSDLLEHNVGNRCRATKERKI